MKVLNIVTVQVIHEGKPLLISRTKNPYAGWWALPGGKLEGGESNLIGALRELKEETGIVVDKAEYIATVNEVYTIDGVVDSHFVLHYYRVEIEELPNVVESPEGKLQWFRDIPDRSVPSDKMICEMRDLSVGIYDLILNLNTQSDELEVHNLKVFKECRS